jgi:hypothetical protein
MSCRTPTRSSATLATLGHGVRLPLSAREAARLFETAGLKITHRAKDDFLCALQGSVARQMEFSGFSWGGHSGSVLARRKAVGPGMDAIHAR